MVRLLTALLIVVGAATPQRTPALPAAQTHTRKSAPAAKLPDAELERAIRARFAKSKIASENFQVRVQGGTATIEGRTNVIQRKGTATRLAKLAGAREVVNKVQVSEEARRKAADKLSTGRRRAQVKRGETPRR